jgi:hypothetical protein
MPQLNQKGIAHIFLTLLLVLGIGVGVYLVKNTVILSSEAANGVSNNNIYNSGVLVIKYFPLDSSGQNLDVSITGVNRTLADARSYADSLTGQGITQMTNGTKFKGYKDSSVPAITYSITSSKEYLDALPVSTNRVPWNPSVFRPNYNQILTRENICDWVDNKGVKQVWLWGYHHGNIEPVESNMAMGTSSQAFWNRGNYGDVSNSEQTNDMPICSKTYTLYNYNYGRGLGELLEDHGHQIEAVFRFVDNILWEKFQRPNGDTNTNIVNHCGWTHSPPNSGDWGGDRGQYDWNDKTIVKSDCEDWKPDGGGVVKNTNCNNWYEPFYGASYATVPCQDDTGVAFKVWWMQNIPGKANTLTYQGKLLRNWWDFYADIDASLASGKALTTSILSPSGVVYKLYSPRYKWYFTSSYDEVQDLLTQSFEYRGVAFKASDPASGFNEVYKVYSSTYGWYFTTSKGERDGLLTQTFENRGPASFYASENPKAGLIPVYKIYSPIYKWYFSSSADEKNNLVQIDGFENRGIAFYIPN